MVQTAEKLTNGLLRFFWVHNQSASQMVPRLESLSSPPFLAGEGFTIRWTSVHDGEIGMYPFIGTM